MLVGLSFYSFIYLFIFGWGSLSVALAGEAGLKLEAVSPALLNLSAALTGGESYIGYFIFFSGLV